MRKASFRVGETFNLKRRKKKKHFPPRVLKAPHPTLPFFPFPLASSLEAKTEGRGSAPSLLDCHGSPFSSHWPVLPA